ncbi:hypothetical protein BH18GEM1_BH18GEM1_05290 [soil metagenome]
MSRLPLSIAVPVHYPGNFAADIEGRVAVSDTGHHRVLFGRIVGTHTTCSG